MMPMPTVLLDDKKLSRIIFSIRSTSPSSLMKKIYGMGITHFDLPSSKHLEPFRELKGLTEDENLMGLCHLEAEEGTSFLGKPLHQFETKVVSTIKKNLSLPHSIRNLPPVPFASEVLTQKEIDRIDFDPQRFEKALSPLHPEESPFLLVGGRYGDWLLALGRIDLLKQMMAKVREKGFTPVYSGQWATFCLPKAKSLDVAAYAVPINKKWSFFDLDQACVLIKKFDRPVISLNPLADGTLLKNSEEAFSFLFKELKITLAIVEIHSEQEVEILLSAAEKIPSIIPPRKT
ncbi:MAG TPA: hypothetical protein VJ462_03655 [Thermodesulfobacteriota bacterium]|jgi:hypothetical protein|nr:hypothetical protein [Thermodesulfobacteriota bacterium]